MNRRVVIPIVLVAVAGVAAFVVLRDGVQDADLLMVSGTVEATEADIGFQAPGRIVSIEVREGDRVTAGQILARLDAAELEARLEGARAQVAVAVAQLSELRSGPRPEEISQARSARNAASTRLADARRELERARTLYEGGAISREAFDRAQTAADVAESQHEQARDQLAALETGTRPERIEAGRAGLAQAQAAVRQVETLIANTTIAAPFDGIVTVRHREPGEIVAAGLPVITIMDPDDRWVRVYMREAAVGGIAIGQQARITADADPEREYGGEITFIAGEAEFTPRAVQTPEERTRLVYAVKVRITGDPDGDLKPGIPADVHIR
jgi:HlyD family secretion protein